jgi:hypothetical protein
MEDQKQRKDGQKHFQEFHLNLVYLQQLGVAVTLIKEIAMTTQAQEMVVPVQVLCGEVTQVRQSRLL